MAKTLNVYLMDQLTGQLTQNDSGELGFAYTAEWLENINAIALSHSLPLRKKPYSNKDCHGFFGGILPEETKRERIAKNLGISKKNDFAMLTEIGGECAGAVSFMPEGNEPPNLPTYKQVSGSELAAILKSLPKRPLMAGEEGIRLSLAGAQDKITVHRSTNNYSIPMNGAPSTHILKPAIERFADSVMNEAFCMTLARKVGLNVAETEIVSIDGIDVLSVKRYDRIYNDTGIVARIHQEDFCQALGIISEMKYQNEGGVSLEQAFALIREVSSLPVLDLQQMIDAVIFNFMIGNHDAHGKNFSLLYQNNKVRLSPFYDLLSTAYYPELSGRMAMKIGGKYKPIEVYKRHFEKLAVQAGLSKPIVIKRVLQMADKIRYNLANVQADFHGSENLANFIASRIEELMIRIRR